jgi:signal transduction histidine kinase
VVTSANNALEPEGAAWIGGRLRLRLLLGVRHAGRVRKRNIRHEVAGYSLAAVLVAAAICLTLALEEVGVSVFLFAFYAAVVASAWVGTGPGCLSVILSVVAVQYFFTPPAWSFEVLPQDVPFMSAFIVCAVMSLAWSAQRKRAERALELARDSLEMTVQQRTAELLNTNAALKVEIAERQAAEQELRRSETLLAQGQKMSRTASWTLQPVSGEMRWSAELFDMFGVEAAAAPPSFRLFKDRVHPDDRPRFDAALALAIEGSTNFSCEVRIVLNDGSTKHVHALGEVKANAARDKEVIGTVMDLTERKRTEQALHDAEADLARTMRLATVAELAASIAHEINQPLAAITTNAGACLRLLARRPAAVSDAREAAACIVADGTRAGEVIARIRGLLSKEGPRHVPLDINRIIRDVLDLSRGPIERQGIAVHTELAGSLPSALGDPVQLQQVLVNLVTNATEAMIEVTDRPRLLTIRSETDGTESVAITVEDTGIGLDPTELDRIFDSFYTTKPDGIGVGLSISRSIIEAHGGQLSALLIEPHGAGFRFTVPVADAGSPAVQCDALIDEPRELAGPVGPSTNGL